MNRLTILALLVAFAGPGLLAACDDDEKSDERSSQQAAATPQRALNEVRIVKTMLAQALAAYQRGDAAGADRTVGNAYLEHFEIVEGPLEERDHELNERLEHLIRETLRERIRQRAPQGEVRRLVSEAQSGLDQAAAKLRR